MCVCVCVWGGGTRLVVDKLPTSLEISSVFLEFASRMQKVCVCVCVCVDVINSSEHL